MLTVTLNAEVNIAVILLTPSDQLGSSYLIQTNVYIYIANKAGI